MEVNKLKIRPAISNYSKVSDYIHDQISFLKLTQSQFSILKVCKKFRRVSPTLVTLIIKNKRKLTLDRVDDMSKLLQLTFSEKVFLRDWIERESNRSNEKDVSNSLHTSRPRRKEVSLNILNDWLNVYVKDCFQILDIQNNPQLIYSHLAHIAEPKRIDKSIQFLLKEGFLRKTLDKKIIIETELAIAETPVPSHKIRQSHKAALNIARNAIDTVSMDKRYVNTLILPLNSQKYSEFVELIQEFSEKIKNFSAELNTEDAEYLYQFNLNLVPTGRREI